MRRFACLLAGWLAVLWPVAAHANADGLPAPPQQVAEGVWVFEGPREHFSRDNGGNILNTGFIVTDAGVVVIDPGPSLRYARAQREAIRRLTGKDVVQVLITHAHSDHFLGSEAYADVPVQALPATVQAIAADGEALASAVYLLVGGAMEGTRARTPDVLAATDTLRIGGRSLRLLALHGHTGADLAVLDEASGVLFAGDLVFKNRAPTTPDADITAWLAALDRLQALPFKVLVPGHGPVVRDASAIEQTRDYLGWARQALTDAAERGLDMNEVMREPIPARFSGLGVIDAEWRRTVIHLYPEIELDAIPQRH